MINLNPKEAIIQNLKDAGCDHQMIENFMLLFNKNQKEKQLALLAIQRQDFLTGYIKRKRKFAV